MKMVFLMKAILPLHPAADINLLDGLRCSLENRDPCTYTLMATRYAVKQDAAACWQVQIPSNTALF